MNDYASVFVILMGLGTVFFGLICLIALTTIMGNVLKKFTESASVSAPAPVPMAKPIMAAPLPARETRPEVIAAVSAAIAEELGTDITGLRILSMKRI